MPSGGSLVISQIYWHWGLPKPCTLQKSNIDTMHRWESLFWPSNVKVLILYDVGFSIEKVCETFPFGRDFVYLWWFPLVVHAQIWMKGLSIIFKLVWVDTPLTLEVTHIQATGFARWAWSIFWVDKCRSTRESQATWVTTAERYEAFIRWSKLTTCFPGGRVRVALFGAFGFSKFRQILPASGNKNMKNCSQSVDSEKSPQYKSIPWGLGRSVPFYCFETVSFSELWGMLSARPYVRLAGQFEKWNMGCEGYVSCEKKWLAGWWFQIFFIFTLTWGDDPIWRIFFKWVETTN